MKTIFLSPYIANDYMTRDVYPETGWKAGRCEVPDEVFRDMLSDADYQARWTDAEPGCKRAYHYHHKKLEAKR